MRRSLPIAASAMLVLVLGGCTSTDDGNEDVSSMTVTVPPLEPPRVEGLRIHQPAWKADGSNWALDLSWDAASDVEVDHYVVSRDARKVAHDVAETSWRDRDVEPGKRYFYTVVGVGTDGDETMPGHASVKTGTPPVADARLEGSFTMVIHVDHASGTNAPVSGGGVVFRFEPSCARGSCSVRWTVPSRATDATLPRSGGTYGGTLRTPFLIKDCHGTEIDETVQLHLRVIGAAPIRHVWRATTIEGTVDETSSSSGCSTASIDWNVRGLLRS